MEHKSICVRIGLIAARNIQLGSEFLYPNKIYLKVTLTKSFLWLEFSML